MPARAFRVEFPGLQVDERLELGPPPHVLPLVAEGGVEELRDRVGDRKEEDDEDSELRER